MRASFSLTSCQDVGPPPCSPNDGPLQLTDPTEDLLDCVTGRFEGGERWGALCMSVRACACVCVWAEEMERERCSDV